MGETIKLWRCPSCNRVLREQPLQYALERHGEMVRAQAGAAADFVREATWAASASARCRWRRCAGSSIWASTRWCSNDRAGHGCVGRLRGGGGGICGSGDAGAGGRGGRSGGDRSAPERVDGREKAKAPLEGGRSPGAKLVRRSRCAAEMEDEKLTERRRVQTCFCAYSIADCLRSLCRGRSLVDRGGRSCLTAQRRPCCGHPTRARLGAGGPDRGRAFLAGAASQGSAAPQVSRRLGGHRSGTRGGGEARAR